MANQFNSSEDGNDGNKKKKILNPFRPPKGRNPRPKHLFMLFPKNTKD